MPHGSVLGPLQMHNFSGMIIKVHSFSCHCYANNTQLYCCFNLMTPTVPAHMSALDEGAPSIVFCAKSEHFVIPINPPVDHNITLQLGSTTLIPTRTGRNLWLVFYEQVSITTYITNPMAQLRKIRPFPFKIWSAQPSSCYFKTGLPQCPIGQPFSQREQSVCRWSRT